ncbi:MAG: hypothetical protein QM740_17855 [Acidovorax sp.]
MSDKTIKTALSDKSGERELEKFLLRDEAARELRKMSEESAKRILERECEQQKLRDEKIRAAKVDILAKRATPELKPPWWQRGKTLKESDVQAAAEHRVDSQNLAEINAMVHEQRQREDAFLAQQKEDRLLREAAEARDRQPAAKSVDVGRDFDRAR